MASGRITTHSILKIDLIVGVRVSCFPGGSVGKESACNSGDPGLIAGLGRSPEEENGYAVQRSCLEYPMERGAWWATVRRIAKSQT